MKTLYLIIVLFIASSGIVGEASSNSEATVLICTGKYSKRYHNSMCRGMNACKGEVKRVAVSTAKKMGLTECGYCY